jgi:hypothetical protein
MCLRKLFPNWFKPEPIPEPIPDPTPSNITLTYLGFGKNNYGGQNLQGCINDVNNLSKKLLELFPDFKIKKYFDSQVTVANYKTFVANEISKLKTGSTVLILPDCCFSGTNTRKVGNPHPITNRFYNTGKRAVPKKIRKRLFKGASDINWIVISGCGEHQTSADCYEGGQWVGAFTYFAIKVLKKGITYKEWFDAIKGYLPSNDYDQAPEIEGPDRLVSRKMFENDTLIIHNSSHGSYITDISGDEKDGVDETIYFDKHLVDDEINTLLQKIPV